jgi:hypothetical protein
MKNSINLAKISNGMLLSLSLLLGLSLLSSCTKDENISPSTSSTYSNLREPKGGEILFSFFSKSGGDAPKSFLIEVNAEGTIRFEGLEGTRLIGSYEMQGDHDILWDVAYEMENMEFRKLENEYLELDGTDTYRVTVLNSDVKDRKKVVDHGVAPDNLTAIQTMIIERTEVKELIGD